jgi:hypothetical protein
MDAAEVLAELKAAGVALARHGGRLRLAPPQAVTRALLEKVREHKAALLALVEEPAPVLCFACKGADFWQGEPIHYTDGTTEPACWLCRRCHPPGAGGRVAGHSGT